jgi:hypothetical protein
VSHMVIFQTPDGNPGYNQFESVDEAVRFVEKLRNDQGIENARMFALEEIKFELKPYYKVELKALGAGSPGGGHAVASAPSAAPSAPAPAPAAPPPPAAPSSSGPGETTPFGAPNTPFAPPSEPAPPSPPSTPLDDGDDGQPQRRGLFGR